MKLLATTVVSLLLVSGPASAAGDAAAGEKLSATCSACHGPTGVSVNPEWPNLAGQHAAYTAKQLADFKQGTARNNAMMTGMVAGLSEQDMLDLGAFYAAKAARQGAANAELVELGEKIYRGGKADTGVAACIACHGPTGVGDPMAGFPLLSGQHAAYTAGQLRMFRSGDRANDMNGMMRDIASAMTDEEIEAVSSYVEGLH